MALDIDFCQFSMPCGKQQCQSTGSDFNLICPLNLTCTQVEHGTNYHFNDMQEATRFILFHFNIILFNFSSQ